MEKKTNLSDYNPAEVPNGENYRIGIVVAEWNADITNALLKGAVDTLIAHHVKAENITTVHVPGSFELPSGADYLIRGNHCDAVICLGCVIQGETRHFDFICQAVSTGLTSLALSSGKPVIFGVLTTNTTEQAIARSGGQHGNKGTEAAVTALKMCHTRQQLLG